MSEYPIDTATLCKGSRILADEIERAINVKRTSRDYSLALLKLRKFIEWRLAERDLEVVTCSERDDIKILTDDEAAPHTDNEFQNALKKARRELRKQASVDRAGITEDAIRAEHDRALVVNGRTYAGAQKARRQAMLPPSPRERLTPGTR
jgi:hypothetical protein